MCLTLDGTDHNALYEVLLDEGVYAKDGSGCNDDNCILNEFASHEDDIGVAGCLHVSVGHFSHVVHDQDLPEEHLQGPFVVGTQIDQSVEPCIPVTDGVVQSKNSHGSFGQRHCDLDEDRKVVCTVKLS